MGLGSHVKRETPRGEQLPSTPSPSVWSSAGCERSEAARHQAGPRAAGHTPFSTLREQGSSKLFLMLGQEAWVFQVLAKAAAEPSTTPLMVRKSSAWFWLKFPHRPGVEGSVRPLRAQPQGWTWVPGGDALTAGLPSDLRLQPHKHLHDGHQLDVQLQAQLGLGDDEEGGRSEERDVGCGHRGPHLSGREGQGCQKWGRGGHPHLLRRAAGCRPGS